LREFISDKNKKAWINTIRQVGERDWRDDQNSRIFIEKRGLSQPQSLPTIPEYPFESDCDYKAGVGKVWRCERCRKDFNTVEKRKLPNECPICIKTRALCFATTVPIFYIDFPPAEEKRAFPSIYNVDLNFEDYAPLNYETAGQHAARMVKQRAAKAAVIAADGEPRANSHSDSIPEGHTISGDERSKPDSSLEAAITPTDKCAPDRPSPDSASSAKAEEKTSGSLYQALSSKKDSYPGGKNTHGVYHTIINQIPLHLEYVELFLGSGAIMRQIKHSGYNVIGVDADRKVIEAFKTCAPDDFKAQFKPDFIPKLKLVNSCALDWIRENRKWIKERHPFIYCDPPYLLSTRKCKEPIYRHEFWTEEQHAELLELLLELSAESDHPAYDAPLTKIMISGYRSELYDRVLGKWRRIDFETTDRRANVRTELIWMNYPQPVKLANYRYLGKNFRERERIKRMQKRWKENLLEMPEIERLEKRLVSPAPRCRPQMVVEHGFGNVFAFARIPSASHPFNARNAAQYFR
ncbi:MAG TPA: DNA adenine methylase, partial [Pyrinomonadaceae bacterium]